MESTVQSLDVNLFSADLPVLNDIDRLSRFVNSSEANRQGFAAQLEANMLRPSLAAGVGIGLFILGRNAEASEKLSAAKDSKEKFFYLALAFRRLKKFKNAIESLQKCLSLGADTLTISLEKASTYRHALDLEAAEKELKNCSNFENVSADYHYQLGQLQEARGLYSLAADSYKTAVELSPNHQKSLFRLAYRCDLSGNDDAAIDYYRQILSESSLYINALLNLAVLYEDRGDFNKACQCVDNVLKAYPNHKRAILFKKDLESSKTMFYDEEKEKKKDYRAQIVETPISDFELSVRSRNCFKKMNINTLGDLMRITETELLSYKNFGETSLREIKSILESRGLCLGMALEEKQASLPEGFDAADTVSDSAGAMSKPVDELYLSVRSRKCLAQLNVRTLGDLVRKTEAELLGCKNFGTTSLNEIKQILAGFGLSLRTLD